MPLSRHDAETALKTIKDPYFGQDWLTLGFIHDLAVSGDKVSLALQLPYPAKSLALGFRDSLEAALRAAGFAEAAIQVNIGVPRARPQQGLPGLERVKNIVAVASGKGGVGKSTTAVNLALALAVEGARVGILDADIYGPSQPLMLGIATGTRPEVEGEAWFKPLRAHGIDAMSIGFLLDGDNVPVVWRGPKATGALLQLLTQTLWSDLDYLVVDMPPGTGDIQLTLAQKVPVAGAVIVTTPQDIALLDAKKGIEMFRKVEIPVLGVVENMAIHVCTNCGHAEPIFGAGGGERIAKEYQTELLGALPLDLGIRQQADSGMPSVVSHPQGDIAARYRDIARRVGVAVAKGAQAGSNRIPNIVFE
jgi:ATP-binding protein involved in chromosome partitioning